MKVRKIHRLMGTLLLLPLMIWSMTGLIFFLKPGYAKAYAPLAIPNLPMTAPIALPALPDALEIKLLKTPLGPSLLVRNSEGWQHLDPTTMTPKKEPNTQDFKRLLDTAIAPDRKRYGHITQVEGMTATTDTGVRITLSWQTLRLRQYGKDTARIDWFYKLHYLQWTGNKAIDRAVGLAGLILVMAMALSGLWLLFNNPKPR